MRLNLAARGLTGLCALVCAGAPSAAADKPALVVQISVDQLRSDLLVRYRPAFAGGLARLTSDGWWIRNGEVDHGLTNSFPGHTTLATGRHPASHGLTANEWWVQRDSGWTSGGAVADDRFELLADPARDGPSPKNIIGSSLADWIKAADPRSKAVALSSAGTIAVAYGGREPDALYWYDGRSGLFTTSTYYGAAPHGWLAEFNESELPRFMRTEWMLSVPQRFIGLARPDASSYENGGINFTFPHRYARESQPADGGEPTPLGAWFAGTPAKDDALFDLAAKAVAAERLGQRGATDYLAIAADTTDSAGHDFGPNSLEQLDTLLRLDRSLGQFLDDLDRTVGKGRYIVALSADHGVADPPEETGKKRVGRAEIEELLDRVEAIAAAHRGRREELIERIVAELKGADFVADAYSEARLSKRSDDPYVELYRRSFMPGRTPDFPLWSDKPRLHHPARYGITVRFEEGMIFDYATAVHGSPYAYDRAVPIIFYGAGLSRCPAAVAARTVDVAPTLARLAGVPAPAGLDGTDLSQNCPVTGG